MGGSEKDKVQHAQNMFIMVTISIFIGNFFVFKGDIVANF